MVGIDTNILLRFIVQDHSEQTRNATQLLSSNNTFFVTNIVMAEIVWTLQRAYYWKRTEIVNLLETLLEAGNLEFESEASVIQATWAYKTSGDWSDHLIKALCKKYHCTSLVTFDQKFAQFYPDFVKLLS